MLDLRLEQDPRMAESKAIQSAGLHGDLLVNLAGLEVAQVAPVVQHEVAEEPAAESHQVDARQNA